MFSGRRAAMTASCRPATSDAERPDEEELARPSRCLGWTRADLLYHLLLDAQRALVAFAAPATALPDADVVSYWAPFRPGDDTYAAHARFVRRSAAACQPDLAIVAQRKHTATAAAHAATALDGDARVAVQGHVMAGDFLATLTVEATIHHLGLVAGGRDLAGMGDVR